MSNETTAKEATTNAGAIALAVWTWLVKKPIALAIVFFLLGYMIG